MAQIRVEEKRGGLGWLWGLIALLVAAALIWYFMVNRRPATSGGEVAPGAAPAEQRKDTVILPRRLEAMPVAAPWAAHHRAPTAPPLTVSA